MDMMSTERLNPPTVATLIMEMMAIRRLTHTVMILVMTSMVMVQLGMPKSGITNRV